MSSPSDTRSLDALYAQAAEATRRCSRSFFFVTRHFPKGLARSAHAVYWFCNYTRELGRQAESLPQGRAELDQWASLVHTGLRGRLARHPVLDVFLDTLDHRSIPHEYPLELIEGVRTDLESIRYASFSQLRSLCYRLGSMISLMLTHVIGFRGPAVEYMADLGLAMELTSRLRDTGVDLSSGRIYLPLEDMEAFGYSEADLGNKTRNDAFRRLMLFQTGRIHAYYQNAEFGLPLLDPRGRFAAKVAFDIYRQTLRQIEDSDFDVFRRRTQVPAVERVWIAARSMAGPITRRLLRVMSA